MCVRELIAASLKGDEFLPADRVHLRQASDYGGLCVLNDAWTRYRLDELFASMNTKGRSIY